MHIWLAVDIDGQLGEVRAEAVKIEQRIAPKISAFTLPMHVSLKISFQIAEELYAATEAAALEYFKTVAPFEIEADGIEREGNIVWIRMKESEHLLRLHRDLDRLMEERFGITPHPFDLDFKFHTTLLMDENEEKAREAYEMLKNLEIPRKFKAESLILGASESGKAGTYKVLHKVKIK